MTVSYKKLWYNKTMERKDLEKQAGVSHYIMTQMGRDKDVSSEALRKICAVLDCKIEDIMEYGSDND